ncbi:MAG: cell division protein ZipA C-terminal FtsZ-binding domain-containing protein [Gammaproteobacteria bacterium]
MWILYLILIALGVALVIGIYFYTRSHPPDEPFARDEYSTALEEAGSRDELSLTRRRAPVPYERNAMWPDKPAAAQNGSKIFTVTVRLAEAGIPTATVIETLARLGFTPGEHQIYHRIDSDGTPLYSVADLFEPGILHPLPEDSHLRGLAFFFAAQPGAAAVARLDRMLGAVHECAERLGGHIEDREHHPLTAARELELKLTAAGARGG